MTGEKKHPRPLFPERRRAGAGAPSSKRSPRGGKRAAKTRTVTFLLLSLLLLSIAGCGIYSWRFIGAVRELVPGEIAVDGLADGEYEGEYRVFHVYARVRVQVAGGKIVEVELVNAEKMQRADAARIRETLARVVERQSLQVDLVSGASASQKVALKAVENALTPP
jgi:uncharacterized protein with FMN-binding domain